MDLYGFKDNKRGRGKNDQKSNTIQKSNAIQFQKRKRREGKK